LVTTACAMACNDFAMFRNVDADPILTTCAD
jgi:hypothetical protein